MNKLLLLTPLLAFTACTCDDGIRLPAFSEREFQEINAVFAAPGGSCGGTDEGRITVRFILNADDGTTIRPGELIGTSASAELNSDNVGFSDTTLFEVPAEPRRTEGQCSGECRLEEMECVAAATDSANGARCQRIASIAIDGDFELVSDPTKSHVFGVLVENSGSIEGWLPSDVAALHPDWDDDGVAEGSPDTAQNRSRASDVNRHARAALAVLINNWTVAADSVAGEREALFGLWEFAGTSTDEVLSLVGEASGTPWTSDDAVAEAARGEFTESHGTRANVFMAMLHLINEEYSQPAYSSFDKTLVVLVDGPDDLRLPMLSASHVIERAQAVGVRVFMVHLDASQVLTTMAGTPVFRDDPSYWDNADVCSVDADCKNFEECRRPVRYGTRAQGAADIATDNFFCMPARDPVDGRFGPIAEYGEIGCATGGGYIYVRGATGLRPRIDWLPFAMDGLWQVQATVDALRGAPAGEVYHVQTMMSVALGGVERTYEFSRNGEPAAADEGRDTRAVLFD